MTHVDVTNVDSAEAPLVLDGGNLALAYQAPFSVAPAAVTSEPSRGRLQFWMVNNPDANYPMGVDNSNVTGMNYSALDPTISIIRWENGVGNIEYNDGTRLRQNFIDVTPYAPFFQQFMALLVGITLTQAQKIQTDLIDVLYDGKRQMPYHQVVAAGDFMWEATDPTVAAMSCEVLPTIIGYNTGTSDSTPVGKINALIDQINAWIVNPGNTLVNQINSELSAGNVLVTNINSQVVNVGNNLTVEITLNIVNGVNNTVVTGSNNILDTITNAINAISSQINSGIVNAFAGFISYFNGTVIATINSSLQLAGVTWGTGGGGPTAVASPGLSGAISASSDAFTDVGGLSITHVGGIAGVTESPFSSLAPAFSAIPANPFTTFPHQGITADPAIPPINWTPLGATATVVLSATEMGTLMNGIAQRRASLLNVCQTKKNAVNALTTLAAVIAYDVTAGWPAV